MNAAMDVGLLRALHDQGVLTEDAVRRTHARHQQFGGAVDTILLELGLLAEPDLARWLAERADVSTVPETALMAIPKDAVERLPASVAERVLLCPFAVQPDGGLEVLSADPPDTRLIEDVAAMIGSPVTARVVPEVRLHQALAWTYKMPLRPRFHALLSDLGAKLAADAEVQAHEEPGAPIAPKEWSLAEALTNLNSAQNRDGALDVAVSFACAHLPFSAIVGVRGGLLHGWHRMGDVDGAMFEGRALSVPANSLVQRVVESRTPFVGRPERTAGNTLWFSWLGRRRPQTAIVLPVLVADRVVAVFVADGGQRPVGAAHTGPLVTFASQLGTALEGLLRRRQQDRAAQEKSPSRSPIDGTSPFARALQMSGQLSGQGSGPAAGTPLSPPVTSGALPRLPVPHAVRASTAQTSTAADVPMLRASGTDRLRGVALDRADTREVAQDDALRTDVEGTPAHDANPPAPRTMEMYDAESVGIERDGDLVDLASSPFVEPELRDPAPDTAVGDPDDESWEQISYDEVKAAGGVDLQTPDAPEDAEATREARLGTGEIVDAIHDAPTGEVVTLATRAAAADTPGGGERPAEPAPADGTRDQDTLNAAADADDGALATDGDDARDAPQGAEGVDLAALEKAVAQLHSLNPAKVRAAHGRLLDAGEHALDALTADFPGRIARDPFKDQREPATAAELGPLVHVLCEMGPLGATVALPFLDHGDAITRYAACFVFAAVPDARGLEELPPRLHDHVPEVRVLAARGLSHFIGDPRFDKVVNGLRGRLTSHVPDARRRATQFLGYFRDVASIPSMIEQLDDASSVVALASKQALRQLSLQDHGSRRKAWAKWWKRAQHESRVDWLLAGLLQRDRQLRLMAAAELTRIAGEDFGFRVDGASADRTAAAKRFQAWWRAQAG